MHDIDTIDTFALPPDSGGAVTAFSRLGYDLEHAIADLIDNSIDAHATTVEVTFFRDDTEIVAVTVADNGNGMTEQTLREAMRFAGKGARRAGGLGAFGLGLKSASLSQCKTLSVIARSGATTSACRWTIEGIHHGWQCSILDPGAAAERFRTGYSVIRPPLECGTLVVWERLTRLGVTGDLDQFLPDLLNRLEWALGLIFHRFIGRNSIAVFIGVRALDEKTGIPRQVGAHNPFGYAKSGRPGYPKTFRTSLTGVGEMALDAHIWPAGSLQPDFRLGRRTGTSFQGINFYRNDRLIQGGGWNGLVRDTTDVELSLARIAVDLPESAMQEVTVQKSAIQVTAALSHALEKASSGRVSLQNYLEDARRTYRAGRRNEAPSSFAPIVPEVGIPISTARSLHKQLTSPGKVFRSISFEWISLPKGQVFKVDVDRECIFLNQKYRRRILGRVRASPVDAPVIKLLIFLLLESDFHRERTSAKRRDLLDRWNAIVFEAIRSL
jgi:hypothetical protein